MTVEDMFGKLFFLKRASRSLAKTGKFWPKVAKKASGGREADDGKRPLGDGRCGVFTHGNCFIRDVE